MATQNCINTGKPIEVANGGTGRATLTSNGVLVGAATSAITQLTAGTNGQVLVGSSAAAPVFATLASTLGTIAYTTGAGTLNLDIAAIPSFFAYRSSTASNVTGDGTAYTIVHNTEQFDTLGNFNNGTGTFTAPTNGLYCFGAQVVLGDVGVAHTSMNFYVQLGTGQTYSMAQENPGVTQSAGQLTRAGTVLFTMTAGGTANVIVGVSGGTKVVDVLGDAGGGQSIFWGFRALRT